LLWKPVKFNPIIDYKVYAQAGRMGMYSLQNVLSFKEVQWEGAMRMETQVVTGLSPSTEYSFVVEAVGLNAVTDVKTEPSQFVRTLCMAKLSDAIEVLKNNETYALAGEREADAEAEDEAGGDFEWRGGQESGPYSPHYPLTQLKLTAKVLAVVRQGMAEAAARKKEAAQLVEELTLAKNDAAKAGIDQVSLSTDQVSLSTDQGCTDQAEQASEEDEAQPPPAARRRSVAVGETQEQALERVRVLEIQVEEAKERAKQEPTINGHNWATTWAAMCAPTRAVVARTIEAQVQEVREATRQWQLKLELKRAKELKEEALKEALKVAEGGTKGVASAVEKEAAVGTAEEKEEEDEAFVLPEFLFTWPAEGQEDQGFLGLPADFSDYLLSYFLRLGQECEEFCAVPFIHGYGTRTKQPQLPSMFRLSYGDIDDDEEANQPGAVAAAMGGGTDEEGSTGAGLEGMAEGAVADSAMEWTTEAQVLRAKTEWRNSRFATGTAEAEEGPTALTDQEDPLVLLPGGRRYQKLLAVTGGKRCGKTYLTCTLVLREIERTLQMRLEELRLCEERNREEEERAAMHAENDGNIWYDPEASAEAARRASVAAKAARRASRKESRRASRRSTAGGNVRQTLALMPASIALERGLMQTIEAVAEEGEGGVIVEAEDEAEDEYNTSDEDHDGEDEEDAYEKAMRLEAEAEAEHQQEMGRKAHLEKTRCRFSVPWYIDVGLLWALAADAHVWPGPPTSEEWAFDEELEASARGIYLEEEHPSRILPALWVKDLDFDADKLLEQYWYAKYGLGSWKQYDTDRHNKFTKKAEMSRLRRAREKIQMMRALQKQGVLMLVVDGGTARAGRPLLTAEQGAHGNIIPALEKDEDGVDIPISDAATRAALKHCDEELEAVHNGEPMQGDFDISIGSAPCACAPGMYDHEPRIHYPRTRRVIETGESYCEDFSMALAILSRGFDQRMLLVNVGPSEHTADPDVMSGEPPEVMHADDACEAVGSNSFMDEARMYDGVASGVVLTVRSKAMEELLARVRVIVAQRAHSIDLFKRQPGREQPPEPDEYAIFPAKALHRAMGRQGKQRRAHITKVFAQFQAVQKERGSRVARPEELVEQERVEADMAAKAAAARRKLHGSAVIREEQAAAAKERLESGFVEEEGLLRFHVVEVHAWTRDQAWRWLEPQVHQCTMMTAPIGEEITPAPPAAQVQQVQQVLVPIAAGGGAAAVAALSAPTPPESQQLTTAADCTEDCTAAATTLSMMPLSVVEERGLLDADEEEEATAPLVPYQTKLPEKTPTFSVPAPQFYVGLREHFDRLCGMSTNEDNSSVSYFSSFAEQRADLEMLFGGYQMLHQRVAKILAIEREARQEAIEMAETVADSGVAGPLASGAGAGWMARLVQKRELAKAKKAAKDKKARARKKAGKAPAELDEEEKAKKLELMLEQAFSKVPFFAEAYVVECPPEEDDFGTLAAHAATTADAEKEEAEAMAGKKKKKKKKKPNAAPVVPTRRGSTLSNRLWDEAKARMKEAVIVETRTEQLQNGSLARLLQLSVFRAFLGALGDGTPAPYSLAVIGPAEYCLAVLQRLAFVSIWPPSKQEFGKEGVVADRAQPGMRPGSAKRLAKKTWRGDEKKEHSTARIPVVSHWEAQQAIEEFDFSRWREAGTPRRNALNEQVGLTYANIQNDVQQLLCDGNIPFIWPHRDPGPPGWSIAAPEEDKHHVGDSDSDDHEEGGHEAQEVEPMAIPTAPRRLNGPHRRALVTYRLQDHLPLNAIPLPDLNSVVEQLCPGCWSSTHPLGLNNELQPKAKPTDNPVEPAVDPPAIEPGNETNLNSELAAQSVECPLTRISPIDDRLSFVFVSSNARDFLCAHYIVNELFTHSRAPLLEFCIQCRILFDPEYSEGHAQLDRPKITPRTGKFATVLVPDPFVDLEEEEEEDDGDRPLTAADHISRIWSPKFLHLPQLASVLVWVSGLLTRELWRRFASLFFPCGPQEMALMETMAQASANPKQHSEIRSQLFLLATTPVRPTPDADASAIASVTAMGAALSAAKTAIRAAGYARDGAQIIFEIPPFTPAQERGLAAMQIKLDEANAHVAANCEVQIEAIQAEHTALVKEKADMIAEKGKLSAKMEAKWAGRFEDNRESEAQARVDAEEAAKALELVQEEEGDLKALMGAALIIEDGGTTVARAKGPRRECVRATCYQTFDCKAYGKRKQVYHHEYTIRLGTKVRGMRFGIVMARGAETDAGGKMDHVMNDGRVFFQMSGGVSSDSLKPHTRVPKIKPPPDDEGPMVIKVDPNVKLNKKEAKMAAEKAKEEADARLKNHAASTCSIQFGGDGRVRFFHNGVPKGTATEELPRLKGPFKLCVELMNDGERIYVRNGILNQEQMEEAIKEENDVFKKTRADEKKKAEEKAAEEKAAKETADMAEKVAADIEAKAAAASAAVAAAVEAAEKPLGAVEGTEEVQAEVASDG
jgi:hypothetical protein